MKRMIAIIMMAALAIIGVGCTPKSEEPTPPTPTVTAVLTAHEDKVSCDYTLIAYTQEEATLVLPDAPLNILGMQPEGEVEDGVIKWKAQGEVTLSVRYEMTLPASGSLSYAKHLYLLPDYLPRWHAPCDMTVTWILPSAYLVAHGGELVDRHYADGVQTRTYRLTSASRVAMVAGTGLVGKQLPEADDWHYYYVWDARATSTAMVYRRAYEVFQSAWGTLPNPQVALLTIGEEGVWEGVTILPNAIPAGDASPIHAAAAAWWETLTVEDAPWIAKSLSAYGVWYYFNQTDDLKAYNYHLQAHRLANGYDFVHGATRLDLPLSVYDKEGVQAVLECRGMLMWYTLYRVLGERLNQALASLSRDVPYTTGTFVSALTDRLGEQYRGYFDAWLQGKVLLV